MYKREAATFVSARPFNQSSIGAYRNTQLGWMLAKGGQWLADRIRFHYRGKYHFTSVPENLTLWKSTFNLISEMVRCSAFRICISIGDKLFRMACFLKKKTIVRPGGSKFHLLRIRYPSPQILSGSNFIFTLEHPLLGQNKQNVSFLALSKSPIWKVTSK